MSGQWNSMRRGGRHGPDRGGRGGRLMCRCPVGVVVVIAPPWTRVAQPIVSFARLQAAQQPLPLRRSVSPPLLTARAWSVCRIGASQYGVRQNWSRAMRNIRATCGKSRLRASVPASSAVVASV